MSRLPYSVLLLAAAVSCRAAPPGRIDVAALDAPTAASLEHLQGAWVGTVGDSAQRIVFRFEGLPHGEAIGVLDMPDDGRRDVPLTAISASEGHAHVDGHDLLLAFDSLGFRFRGWWLPSPPRLEGTLSDGHRVFGLRMSRRDPDSLAYRVPRLDAAGRRELRFAYTPPQPAAGWSTGQLDAPSVTTLTSVVEEVLSGQLPGVDAVLVARDGVLMVEEYFHGFDRDRPHQLRSVTKSVASLLVGVALGRGHLISLDQTLASLDPALADELGWSPAKRSITLDHLLTMTSGLRGNDWRAGQSLQRATQASPDWVRFVGSLPLEAPPGTRFAYNGPSLVLLARALQRASGRSVQGLATDELFAPLGIEHAGWYASPSGTPSLGAGLSLRPVDLARLGQLVLDDGLLAGRRLIPAGFVSRATHPLRFVPHMDCHYASLWWRTTVTTPAGDVLDVTMALGRGGQALFVVPERSLVMVVLAGNYQVTDRARQSRSLLPRLIDLRPIRE